MMMIQVPRNIKDGDILIYRGGKLEAVDPKSVINYDQKIKDLKNDVKVLANTINSVIAKNNDFIKKLEEAFGNE